VISPYCSNSNRTLFGYTDLRAREDQKMIVYLHERRNTTQINLHIPVTLGNAKKEEKKMTHHTTFCKLLRIILCFRTYQTLLFLLQNIFLRDVMNFLFIKFWFHLRILCPRKPCLDRRNGGLQGS
jgi:hypothetical protein